MISLTGSGKRPAFQIVLFVLDFFKRGETADGCADGCATIRCLASSLLTTKTAASFLSSYFSVPYFFLLLRIQFLELISVAQLSLSSFMPTRISKLTLLATYQSPKKLSWITQFETPSTQKKNCFFQIWRETHPRSFCWGHLGDPYPTWISDYPWSHKELFILPEDRRAGHEHEITLYFRANNMQIKFEFVQTEQVDSRLPRSLSRIACFRDLVALISGLLGISGLLAKFPFMRCKSRQSY